MTEKPNKSTLQQVLDAIANLCEENKLATRESIQKATNLPYTIIDDRIKVLIDEREIIRVQRGNFVVANQFNPPRVVSKTINTDGTVVLDIGDTVLHLTPREARNLGQLLVGDAFLYTLIGLSAQFEQICGVFHQRIRNIEKKQRKESKKNFNQNSNQGLFEHSD